MKLFLSFLESRNPQYLPLNFDKFTSYLAGLSDTYSNHHHSVFRISSLNLLLAAKINPVLKLFSTKFEFSKIQIISMRKIFRLVRYHHFDGDLLKIIYNKIIMQKKKNLYHTRQSYKKKSSYDGFYKHICIPFKLFKIENSFIQL